MSLSYYTPEGFKKLKEELEHLRSVERPRVSGQIAEARDKGDLSENAEYDAAKEAQGMLEMKIARMEELVANARIVDESQLDATKVLILSKVKVRNPQTSATMTYTLVSEQEADLKSGKISVNSPIGKGLLGKAVGEVAEIQIPSGLMSLEVVSSERSVWQVFFLGLLQGRFPAIGLLKQTAPLHFWTYAPLPRVILWWSRRQRSTASLIWIRKIIRLCLTWSALWQRPKRLWFLVRELV
jgi:transcription elongation factor GreA